MGRTLKAALAAVFVVAGFGLAAAHAAPLEAYSRLPAIQNVEISDDGQAVAYIAQREGRTFIVAQQLDGTVLQTVNLGDAKVRQVLWAGPDHIAIISSTTKVGMLAVIRSELSQGVSVNVRNGSAVEFFHRVQGNVTYTTAFGGPYASGVDGGDRVIYVGALAGGPSSPNGYRWDVVRINLENGVARTAQMGNEDAYDYLVRGDGAVVARVEYDNEHGDWKLWLRRADGDGGLRVVKQLNAPLERPWLAGFTADDRSIVLGMWNEDEQLWRYLPVSLDSGELGAPLIPAISAGLVHDDAGHVIGYRQLDDFNHYAFFDPALQSKWRELERTFAGRQLSLASSTPDLSKLVVFVEGTGLAGSYFLYDVAGARVSQIGQAYPEIGEIAEVRSIRYAAADGTEIPAYLTLPSGRAARALPLVVLPHGGPEGRDVAGFDWIAQALASRGYAVLQPNFRGSAGYGAAFRDKGYGEVGRKMQTDLSDGVSYLAQQGIVDPQRVCIAGGSYGGYAALAGVTLQDGVYRCSVAIAPVSDFRDFLAWDAQQSGERSRTMRYWTRYLAVSSRSDQALDQVSPRRAAAHGTAPVLIIHGRDDTVVPYAQGADMVRALRAAGRDVTLVELSAEDHWLSREPTRRQTLSAMVEFIERHNPPN